MRYTLMPYRDGDDLTMLPTITHEQRQAQREAIRARVLVAVVVAVFWVLVMSWVARTVGLFD